MDRPSDRTNRLPFVVDRNRRGAKLTRIELTERLIQEEWIQEVLCDNPALLPYHDTDWAFHDPVCIGREVETSVGPMDNLYINRRGRVSVVECKLYRNPESRRKVVGQILDYAAQLRQWDYDKLDAICRAHHHERGASNRGLFETLAAERDLEPEGEARFVDAVNEGLRDGHFMLMILGDGIQAGLEAIAELVRGKADLSFTLALGELQLYELDNGNRLVVPYLIQRTETIVERISVRVSREGAVSVSVVPDVSAPVRGEQVGASTGAGGQRRRLDVEEFLSLLPGDRLEPARTFLRRMEACGLTVEPRASALSFRLANRVTGGSDFTILVLTTKGEVYPRSLVRQLRQSGLDPRLGIDFVERAAALLPNTQPKWNDRPEEVDLGLNWSRQVAVQEVLPQLDQIAALVERLAAEIADFEEGD